MRNSEEIINRIRLLLDSSNTEKDIFIHEPDFSKSNAHKYVDECIDSGWVSSAGRWVKKFENIISEFTGAKYVIAVSNGTNALRMALYISGVGANDEVIIPPLSFVATANAIAHLGASPHFVDIESESLGISPNALSRHLESICSIKNGNVYNKISGNRIAAVVPVHVFGLPSKIEEIKKICIEWNLPLIEDAAEALGSKVKTSNQSMHCGCFGDLASLSFNGNKIITTGGGGAILTNNAVNARKAKHLTTTAKIPHPWNFYHDEVGWNDRLPNINAALGAAQMEKLQEKLNSKRILHSMYKNLFKDLEGIEIISELKNTESNYWLTTMRLNGDNPAEFRENILKEAHNAKIFIRPSWELLSKLPMYKNAPSSNLDEAINQSKRLINLPSSPQLINII